ncbi:circadian clock protein KaiC [Alsobacter metallidurans]|uniref:non-specific serine/threonine protein kinase n=1 Tax=Alsobacter metallidurans TaxID=340221 RepID=A0A917MK08_9HYPH|nr:ATPase domain-containing protein [Alsobacter metallidurans]GGH21004.1 circadian clock protein KaiC [Alsobacter metallidurans]
MPQPSPRTPTGIEGLDAILGGGLTADRLYLVEGTPGTGKTTLALQFLLEGHRLGERGLYVTLSETASELRAVAVTHGWNLDGVELVELVPELELEPDYEQTLLHPSEVELGETVRGVMERFEQFKPKRLVLDSLSELRLLAQNPLRYRRQILALKQFFATRSCTVLVLDDRTSQPGDLQLHSIAHGVISLDQSATGFGAERRRLRIIKMRGLSYSGGYHDFAIRTGGMAVYPRMVASEHPGAAPQQKVTTSVPELDHLLGGGLVAGTTTLLSGPAGVGKTTVAVRCMVSALQQGHKAMYFLFDERLPTLLVRSADLGMDLQPFLDSGALTIRQIDPAELSPGEFAVSVRRSVENGARVVLVDSLNAYLQAMPEERHLTLQMHELLTYLGQQGVLTIMILGQHGLVGDIRSDIDLSYLADTVLLLRFFEADGEVRKAISVIKTRTTDHERTIREFVVDRRGLSVGEPLRQFAGVLSGAPEYRGDPGPLLGPNAQAVSHALGQGANGVDDE